MGCPIFTYNDILQEAGIILTDDYTPTYKDDDLQEKKIKKDVLETLSIGELKKQMNEKQLKMKIMKKL